MRLTLVFFVLFSSQVATFANNVQPFAYNKKLDGMGIEVDFQYDGIPLALIWFDQAGNKHGMDFQSQKGKAIYDPRHHPAWKGTAKQIAVFPGGDSARMVEMDLPKSLKSFWNPEHVSYHSGNMLFKKHISAYRFDFLCLLLSLMAGGIVLVVKGRKWAVVAFLVVALFGVDFRYARDRRHLMTQWQDNYIFSGLKQIHQKAEAVSPKLRGRVWAFAEGQTPLQKNLLRYLFGEIKWTSDREEAEVWVGLDRREIVLEPVR